MYLHIICKNTLILFSCTLFKVTMYFDINIIDSYICVSVNREDILMYLRNFVRYLLPNILNYTISRTFFALPMYYHCLNVVYNCQMLYTNMETKFFTCIYIYLLYK